MSADRDGDGGLDGAEDGCEAVAMKPPPLPTPVPRVPSAEAAGGRGRVGRLGDGRTFGPTGIYGGWVRRSRLLDVFRQTLKPGRLLRIEEVLRRRVARVQCVFENLRDPGNGAACLRTMDAFGLQYAHAVEAYEPFVVSSGVASAADKWVTVTRHRSCNVAADELKKKGFTLVATCLDEDAMPIEKIDFQSMAKIAILFGNEERGLSLGFRQRADVKCFLPMRGFTQSYNISVSCALVLYHLHQAGVLVPDLSSEEATYFYKQWVIRSTKQARMLIERHNFYDECDDF